MLKTTAKDDDTDKAKVVVPVQKEFVVGVSNPTNIEIKIEVNKPSDANKIKNVLLKISLNAADFEDSKYITVKNEVIAIPASDFSTSDKVVKSIYCSVETDSSFELNKNKLAAIKIEAYDSNTLVKIDHEQCIIKLIKSFASASGEDGVSFALGTNLDLADGSDPLSFYGRLSYFDHSILKVKKKKKVNGTNNDKKEEPKKDQNSDKENEYSTFGCIFNTMGIYGGVYQNRFVKDVETTPEMEFYKALAIYNDDSIKVNRTFGTQKTTTRFDNYGFLLSLPFTLSSKKAETPRHHGFFSFTPIDFELIFRKAITSYEYTNSISDTIKIQKDSINSTTLIKGETTVDFIDHYWGLTTFQYSMSGQKYKVFIKGTPLGLYWHDGLKAKYACYNFYFGVTERNLGIRIGGEIKGIYSKDPPFFNLFITKSFNLSKLGSALIGD